MRCCLQRFFVFYQEIINLFSLRNLIHEIDRAMNDEELYVLYQPKVCSSTKIIFGVEALLRWNHPVHGVISPGIFIPVLEENG
jgi:diguanylate cyclase